MRVLEIIMYILVGVMAMVLFASALATITIKDILDYLISNSGM